ncbi:hypothetical protein THARTR1_01143 [Trichoderma harzianum]|uniref:Uncharacterized protein n=1 Tax=Trichoderma harzianum TaxID=5544 RepID=A0A2K0UMB4_TRIHA|nr:hypothetical protein THARTR1_01143 [Trichoderma harzianum]
MDPEKLQELIAKGKTLYDKAVFDINRDGNTFKQLPDLGPNYDINIDPGSDISIHKDHEKSVSELGHPLTDYCLAVAGNVPCSEVPPYQNYIHDKGKAILCMHNFAAQDRLFGKPGRLFWSDLMAACFSQTMTACGCDTNGLDAIWRLNIVNQDTQNVIETYCKDEAVEFGTGDEGFYALLATDHGKDPARMLATYPQMFGRRFMAKVKVFRYRDHLNPCICWILEELPPPTLQTSTQPSGPLSKKTSAQP